jgi:hypothetical protein
VGARRQAASIGERRRICGPAHRLRLRRRGSPRLAAILAHRLMIDEAAGEASRDTRSRPFELPPLQRELHPPKEVRIVEGKTILVGIDFQEASLEALSIAEELAAKLGLELVALHAYTTPVVAYPGLEFVITPNLIDEIADAAKQAIDRLAASHPGMNHRSTGA